MVAGRRDGARRADVEATGAAGDARARMGAQAVGELDEFRLVEGADQLHGVEDDALDGGPVARVGAKVAAAQLVGGKERSLAGQIDDDVAGGAGAVARGAEDEPVAGGGGRHGVIVDPELESAEMAAGAGDGALQHGKIGRARRRDLAGARQQHGDVEMLGQAAGGVDRRLVAAVDEGDPFRLHRHEGDRRHRLGALRRGGPPSSARRRGRPWTSRRSRAHWRTMRAVRRLRSRTPPR